MCKCPSCQSFQRSGCRYRISFLQTFISVINEDLKEKGSCLSALNDKLPALSSESKLRLAADYCYWLVLNSAMCLPRRLNSRSIQKKGKTEWVWALCSAQAHPRGRYLCEDPAPGLPVLLPHPHTHSSSAFTQRSHPAAVLLWMLIFNTSLSLHTAGWISAIPTTITSLCLHWN